MIKDCFSRVSTMIGVFGFGHSGSFCGFVFEKMLLICFFIVMFVVCLLFRSLF